LTLSAQEKVLVQSLSRRPNAGECEAIAIAKTRGAPLLSNDKRAIRYCQQSKIEVLDLVTILNLLWTRQIISKKGGEALVESMEKGEGLTLTQFSTRESLPRLLVGVNDGVNLDQLAR
jgi:predicted nucleic acid-binding protein